MMFTHSICLCDVPADQLSVIYRLAAGRNLQHGIHQRGVVGAEP